MVKGILQRPIKIYSPKEYIVGAQADDVDTAISTSKNLPNPPAGARTAARSPPMSLPPLNPADHDGTPGAAAANAAPTIFHANWNF